MLIQVAGAFMAVVSFSMLLEIPKRYIGCAGFVGAIGWLIYLLFLEQGSPVSLAAFISSLGIAFVSHIFARLFKAPVTVFLVAGILPSVPGASIYRSVYYMIQNDRISSNYYFVETLQIAGAIAMAVFIMDSLFRMRRRK